MVIIAADTDLPVELYSDSFGVSGMLFLGLAFGLPFYPPVDGVEVVHTLTSFVRGTFWGNMQVLSSDHP